MAKSSGLELGIIGLGRMGGNLALHAMEKGIRVAGFDVAGISESLASAGIEAVSSPSLFREKLGVPRVVLIYVPAGEVVDRILDDLAACLEPGDVVADGGNSYWGDSIRRHARMKEKGIRFVDLGTSGGVEGARSGACFMAGGEKDAIARLEPILRELSAPGGFVHAGPAGAGHFVKLVHNGIEFGMLQAIGEGMDMLERYRDRIPIADVLRCWMNGSVVRSWLVELMERAYRSGNGMDAVPSYVDDTGEVNWLVDDALHMEVPVPVISQAVMQLFASRDERKNWARAVSMMRKEFGGHEYGGPHKAVVDERMHGRVGGFYRGE